MATDSTSQVGNSSGKDLVSTVFTFFPSGFRSAAASGWTANIHWAIEGATDQTLAVKDDACSVSTGLDGEPSCTVQTDKDTLLAIFQGELDPTSAFMQGKMRGDNMGDLMKLGMVFDFEAMAKAFKAAQATDPEKTAVETAPASAETAAKPKADTEALVGKRYDGGFWQVSADEFSAYADATNDENPAYRGDDAVAPPMYHVRPFIDLMMKMANDPELELDLLRLVHAGHGMRFHRMLRHGDVLELRAELTGLEQKSSGKLVQFALYGLVEGEIALEGRTNYFIRGEKKSGGKKPKAAAAEEEKPTPTWVFSQPVAKDQADRYAKASGDLNPIHTNENIAKAAGLPGVILHGLCTMAFAQRDIINRVCDGDPTRLKEIFVRFAKPVFPGDSLSMEVFRDGNQLSFTTFDGAQSPVIVNGSAEITA